jgi:hypothetical protein
MPKLRSVAADIENPELLAILSCVDSRGGSAPFTVAEKRRAYRAAVERSGPSEPVASVNDRTIPSRRADEIPIRIYNP